MLFAEDETTSPVELTLIPLIAGVVVAVVVVALIVVVVVVVVASKRRRRRSVKTGKVIFLFLISEELLVCQLALVILVTICIVRLYSLFLNFTQPAECSEVVLHRFCPSVRPYVCLSFCLYVHTSHKSRPLI